MLMHGDMGPVGAMTSLGWRKSRKFRDASQAVERPVSAGPDYGGCSAILQSRFVLSGTGQRQSRSASASGTRDVPDRSWPRDVAPTAWSRSSARRPWAGLPPLAPKAASRSPGEPRPLGRGLARYLAPQQRRLAPLAATARAREGRSPSERVSAFPSERGRTAPTGGRAVTFAQPDAARRHSWRQAMSKASTVLAVPDTTAARQRRSGAQAMAVRATRCGWDTP